ncbi:hypothetical protein [uncultured Thiodictyon sp.]|uniref:hypothetical protein n=1 Tax=uncultured Thiodictyon sp. TaxID=1846217 RepID=UPI0025F5FEF3|nr:hypothetical protein [uncultured Thiodictyon sp.]
MLSRTACGVRQAAVRTLTKVLAWLSALTLLLFAGLAVQVVRDSRPLVPLDRTLTGAERLWAKQWLAAATPTGRRARERITLTLSEDQANILGAYLIERVGPGRVAVRLERDRARVAASLGLPWDPRGRFINLDLSLLAGERLPRIERARLAGLPLPRALVETLAERLTAALDQSGLIQRVAIKPDLALLTYEWHRDALAEVGSGLVSADERARMLRYQGQLMRYGAGRPKRAVIPLPELLTLVLTAAGRQDAAAAPTENRAAILALAAYVNRQGIRDPAQADATAPASVFRAVELRGRADLAAHFMTSAAITAGGGTTLADLVGLYKELSDSQGGSGFSFADLAADRAGTRFGEVATSERKSARLIQQAAARGLTEADIMPSIDGLPEGFSAAAFAAAFQDTKGPAYRRLTDHIERRIDALPFMQLVIKSFF